MKNEVKYVYWDARNYSFTEINREYLETPEKIKEYFGYIDDHLNDDNELIIYELVPFKTLKKENKYKFV